MKMVSLKCPECNAVLEVREGIDTFYCTYCGCKIMLDGISNAAYQAHVQVKAMEHQENIIDKQNEQERFKLNLQDTEKKRGEKIALSIVAGWFILSIVMFGVGAGIPMLKHQNKIKELKRIETQLEQTLNDEQYDNALILANQLYCDDNYSSSEKKTWDTKRENYIALILDKKRDAESEKVEYIASPESSEKLSGKKRTKVEEQFKSAGFTNIASRVTTKKAGLLNWNDTVEHITISGKQNFDKGETFDKNSAIIIYYYSKQ